MLLGKPGDWALSARKWPKNVPDLPNLPEFRGFNGRPLLIGKWNYILTF